MEDVARLSAVADSKGAAVKELKDAGKDVAEALKELLAAKAELGAAATALLPDAVKAVETLKGASASAEEVAAAEKTVAELKAKIPEDKKAKRKREKEEKAAKAAAAKAAEGGAKAEAPKAAEGGDGDGNGNGGEKKLSKKELNKLKRKAAKKAGSSDAAEAGADAGAAAGDAASAGAAASAGSGGATLTFKLMACVVAGLTGSDVGAATAVEFRTAGRKLVLREDVDVAKLLARQDPSGLRLYDGSGEELADVDLWLSLARTSQLTPALLDAHLATHTFAACWRLTLADVALWAALALRGQLEAAKDGKDGKDDAKPLAHLARWVATMRALPGVSAAAGLLAKAKAKQAAAAAAGGAAGASAAGGAAGGKKKKKGPKRVSKLPPLANAEQGKVVTRFPPEPSGHLHIGHCKAMFMNQAYAKLYDGKMLMRFDDTNPSLEKPEFEEGILEDFESLMGEPPALVTYTSDHFERILGCALRLVRQGDAFMDDTPQAQMSTERRAGVESARRELPVRENLRRFFALVFGARAAAEAEAHYDTSFSEEERALLAAELPAAASWCLRAKMDMSCKNKTMCDPVIYRANAKPHARAKQFRTTYLAYPTYDLACPVVDSAEGVTHAMRDAFYLEAEPQYQWFFPKLGLRAVELEHFSRQNFKFTLMSKRKLKWIVEQGIAEGWGDPRFPTVKGVLRRGMHVPAMRAFYVEQGKSANLTLQEWDKFWALNKQIIEPTAPRFLGVSTDNVVVKVQTLAGEPWPASWSTAALHPQKPEMGEKAVLQGPEIIVEREDLEDATANGGQPRVHVGERIILFTWGVMNVLHVELDGDGKAVKGVTVAFDPAGDVKTVNRKIQWVAKSPHALTVSMHEFDHLITKEKVEENDNIEDLVNRNSHAVQDMIMEPAMRSVAKDAYIQIMRRGFFKVDQPVKPNAQMDIFMIPDGKKKAMSTLSSALHHR